MTHKGKEKRGQGWRRALVFLMTLVLICGLAAPVYAADTTETPEQTNQELVTSGNGEEKSGEESNQTDLPAEDTPETGNDEAGQDVQTDTPESEPTQADVVGNDNVTDENNVADENNNTETGTDGNNDTESGTGTTTEGDPTGNETTTESNPATESEAPEVEKSLYDRLMAAESCNAMLTLIQENEADFNAMTPTVAEKEQLSNKVTELPYDESTDAVIEKIAGLKTKEATPSQGNENSDVPEADENTTSSPIDGIFDFLDSGAETLAIGGISDITIKEGETATIPGGHESDGSHTWSSRKQDVATVEGNGTSATVRGISAGSTRITHTYQVKHTVWPGYEYFENVRETCTVTVTAVEKPLENQTASVFYMKTPASDPDSNDTGNWGRCIEGATVNMTGATWVDSRNEKGKNVFANVADYVVSWPDGSTGKTWAIPKSEVYMQDYKDILEAWQTELEQQTGLTGLTLDDIDSIILTPHKISRNNDTNPAREKHIDCKISVVCKKAYTARFEVLYPDAQNYVNVSAQNYRIEDNVPAYTKVEQTREYNNITYIFDGWYNEAGQKVTDDQWNGGYDPSEAELTDGTVYFKAHYIPQPVDMTIKKVFEGIDEAKQPDYIMVSVTEEDNAPQNYQLAKNKGYTVTVTNLDPTKIYYVTENLETAQVENYKLDVTYSDPNGIIPSQSGTNEVTITNTYTPLTTSLTVEKIVTGGLGDKTKSFNFTVRYNGVEVPEKAFVLSNGDKKEIMDIPIGTEVTIEEADYETYNGYTTTYVVKDGQEQNGRTAKWTAAPEGETPNTITFTNFKDATPDTGVLLDSLPYILILAAVVLAVVLMLVLKRRRADD